MSPNLLNLSQCQSAKPLMAEQTTSPRVHDHIDRETPGLWNPRMIGYDVLLHRLLHHCIILLLSCLKAKVA